MCMCYCKPVCVCVHAYVCVNTYIHTYWLYNISPGQIGVGSIGYDLADVVFVAAYPCLVVTDVLGGGHFTHFSKSNLWDMLSIDRYGGHCCVVC